MATSIVGMVNKQEVARGIAGSVRWRPEALLVFKTIRVTLVEDGLKLG